MMTPTQKLKLNSSVSLLTRIVIIFSGLILPKLIISNYGAETHGLVSSIKKFLGIITFLDMGVGIVIRSALYRPLAEKDNKKISSILGAANNYFRKIAYILIGYVLVLVFFYPLLVDSTRDYAPIMFLIIAMSISQFGQFYFGIVNELLLGANQQDYIQLGSEIVVVILNLVISIFLINQNATIEFVILGSSLIYLIRPLFLKYYVNKNFNIDYNIEILENPIPQKWNGVGQHIAYSINNSADVIILTIFSTLENISVYSVYNMVVSAIKMLISSLTTGIQSFFGNLYANNEINLLNDYFDRIEWVVHTGVVYLYGMTAVLISPFVMLYTAGVENISYEAPVFSMLLLISGAIYSIRTPYNSMVLSAGHFRQTQTSSFIEAGLNIVISAILVNQMELVGIAIGTFVSMAYRTLYLVYYLSGNILFRSIKKFIKHIFVDFISFNSIMIVGIFISKVYTITTIIDWIIIAVVIGMISLILLSMINLVVYKEIMLSVVRSVFKRN